MNKEIKQNLKIALKEIGEIKPCWSNEEGMYVFEHPAYPRVFHANPDLEEAKAGYMRALTGFIQDRLSDNLALDAEKVTSGRGGCRPGSGRPVGTTKGPTKLVRLPLDVADWIKQDPSHVEDVRRLMG